MISDHDNILSHWTLHIIDYETDPSVTKVRTKLTANPEQVYHSSLQNDISVNP